MKETVFLDANIIMYALGRDHPLREPCREYLEGVKDGDISVVASTEVLQEIFHRYFSINMPLIAEEAYRAMKTFCKEVYPLTLDDIDRALDLLKESPSINARDAVHAATMLNNGIEKILSTDTHFDKIKGIQRISPETRGRKS